MQTLFVQLKSSADSLKNVHVIAGTAMFCALAAALNMFAIPLSPQLRITFGFLAIAASCRMYGPVPNVIAAFILDFITYMINPTGGYFPGFALTAMVQALLYSWLYYQKPSLGILRICTGRILAVLIGNVLMNSLWLKMMYDLPFWSMLIPRIIKNALLLPLECFLLVIVMRMLQRIPARMLS